MNEVSSRSHAVFIVIAEQSETVYVDEQVRDRTRTKTKTKTKTITVELKTRTKTRTSFHRICRNLLFHFKVREGSSW